MDDVADVTGGLKVVLELAGWYPELPPAAPFKVLTLDIDVVALGSAACGAGEGELWDELAAGLARWPEFARSSALPPRWVDALLDTDNPHIAGWLAMNPTLSTDELDELLGRWRDRRHGYLVREAVGANPNASRRAVDIVRDGGGAVQRALSASGRRR